MIPGEERCAKALQVERMYGQRAPGSIADRIGALVLAGDAAGVQRFKRIAAKFDEMLATARTYDDTAN